MMSAQAGGTYLYAVLAGPEGAGETELNGIEGGAVYRIIAGDISAVVGRVSRARLRPERKHLLAHQAVLRRLMEHTTVLPAAFGLVARSDEAVRNRLLENQDLFREQLAHVAGKVEMGLKVRWSTPNLFDYFVASHPELGAARDRMKGRHDIGREELIEVGKLFENLREADRQAHAERVSAVLRERGVELKWNPVRGETEVMNLSCLVPREELDAFEKRVEAAAEGFDDHFTFEFNGPWAPHSFTELKLPATSAQE
ncbi:MAG TPA: GvpL/GvpF family gas vesicle protein [Archangium sp.]|uniref:GvpL/GvpF family gas vesicle protein n=1 Tax=Archangium sp. TaxID=1872627 RepID=UPI002E356E7D|nr:GvpL/GvpF family gas vesicle protein [Archangium sp.]HEX5754691.1 GvpL/GvpF family gas vesicle protein [Archangium sp.]